MEKQYWILINNELLGPYTVTEIIELNLPDSTPITDNLDNERWRTIGSVDFNVSGAGEQKQEGHSSRHDSYTLRMDGGCYQFYYKQNNIEHGPRTARQMLKLNLSVDTPVSESSLNGQWFVAGNFDFTKLALQEDEVRSLRHRLALRTMGTGAIWLFSGLLVTVISFAANFGGGGVIAIGAMVWGLFKIMAGLFGDDGLTDEERARIFQFVDPDETDSDETKDTEDMVLSPEEITELYAELELTPDVTDYEVRKAYRRMAKCYHPDLQTNFSEEDKKMAAEKFRNIQDAFELIKRLRNMK